MKLGACISSKDNTNIVIDAEDWLDASGRDLSGNAESRAEGLLRANRGVLRDFEVLASISRTQGRPNLHFKTNGKIGALPLLSPMSGKPDYGLIISPRFGWDGIGTAMTGAGFRIVPEFLPLPNLPRSDRQIPAWVISSVVLMRLEKMLKALNRRFQLTQETLSTPKGTIRWNDYASQSIASARPDRVPCCFPDLTDDYKLKSFIHYVLLIHRGALQSQRSASSVIVGLLDLCNSLIAQVSSVTPIMPSNSFLQNNMRSHVTSKVFRDGLESIDWTINERGLAGLEATEGLSWRMDMPAFFEAWCESVLSKLSSDCGLRMLIGREEATRVGITWKIPGTGSQKSLLPDFVLQGQDKTIIVDAKYKVHAEEIENHGWWETDDDIKESHRNDMMQVLAYSGLYEANRTIACLLYPCRQDTYHSLIARNRIIMPAHIAAPRPIDFVLGVVPLGGSSQPTIEAIKDYILAA